MPDTETPAPPKTGESVSETSRRLVALAVRRAGEVTRDPLPMLQLIAMVLLAAAFLLVARDWMRTHDRNMVEVPLLLVGVMAILLIVLRTTQGFALSISVLIVGTVVAGDKFMLAATALWRSNDPSSHQLVRDLYPQRRAPAADPAAAEERAKELADLARSLVAQGTSKPEVLERQFTRVLEGGQLDDLRRRIEGEGADFPFRELAEKSHSDWRNFVSRYRDFPAFREDMELLRVLGLVEFPGSDFETASLTATGTQLAARIASPATSPEIERLPEGPEVISARDPLVAQIGVGRVLESEFETTSRRWFRFVVERAGNYLIQTLDPTESALAILDTVVKVRASDSPTVIAEDDDDGDGLLSRVEVELAPGEYLIEVKNLDAQRSRFRLELREAANWIPAAPPPPVPAEETTEPKTL